MGAYEAGQSAVYDGTGYTEVYLQEWIDQDEPRNFSLVDQALIAYSSADRARDVLDNQVREWERCANRTITVKYPGKVPAHVTFGPRPSGPTG